MHLFKKTILATVATLTFSSATLAADLILDPVAIATPDSAFSWDGLYAGVGINGVYATLSDSDFTIREGMIAGYVGANFVADQFLAGIEGSFYLWSNDFPGTGVGAVLSARAGYLVTPETLIYLSASGEARSNGRTYGSIGAGVEFAVSDNLSIDLEYRQSVVTNYEYTRHNVGVSALWHF